jgi:hypothetical protein
LLEVKYFHENHKESGGVLSGMELEIENVEVEYANLVAGW